MVSQILSGLAETFDLIGSWSEDEQADYRKTLLQVLDLEVEPVEGEDADQPFDLFQFLG